jgi:hypothetical protein
MIDPHRFVETLYSEIARLLSTGTHLSLSAHYWVRNSGLPANTVCWTRRLRHYCLHDPPLPPGLIPLEPCFMQH